MRPGSRWFLAADSRPEAPSGGPAGRGERASCEGDDGSAGNPGHLGEMVLGTARVVTLVREQTAARSYVFIGDV